MSTHKVANLIVDGLKFHSTWHPEDKAVAEACISQSKQYNHTLVLRDYSVNIHPINPKTNAITWDKGIGYSLWEYVL